MKIEIYKEEKDLMCRVPGQGDASLFELCIAIGMFSADQIKIKWGPNIPEIEVTCPLSDKEAAFIEQVKESLEKKYNQE